MDDSSEWYDKFTQDVETSLRRKNSRLRRLCPDLLEAFKDDVAKLANRPRAMPVGPAKSKPEAVFNKADRQFARQIGMKLNTAKTK